MAKPFSELRKLMYAAGVNQDFLAVRLGRSTTYISQRILGRAPWDLADVYGICALFEIPTAQIAVYFPEKDMVKLKRRRTR